MALLGLDNQFSGALNAGYSSGLAKGMLAAKEDNREERKLGMAEEEFGWKREAVEKEKTLQAGMVTAAQDGGYEAVISYLEKADPERAISFTSAKTKLDAQIMNNDVMKNIKIPEMQQDALLESYGKLGKMGQAILQLPEDQREEAYKSMLPIAKVINPDMPDNLQQAAPILLLAAAQATPANQLFKADKEVLSSESNVGKIDVDIKDRLAKGVDPNDPGLQSLVAAREGYIQQAAANTAKLTRAQLGVTKDQKQATDTVSKNLQTASKDFVNFSDSYTSMQAALDDLAKNPTSSAAQNAVSRTFVLAYNKGATSETDAKIGNGAASYEEVNKKLTQLMTGKVVNLNPSEIADISSLYNNLMTQKLTRQKSIESTFQDSTQSFGSLVSWDNVIKPSEQYNRYKQSLADQSIAANGQVPSNIQEQAQAAIKAGADPQKVQARVQQLMQQQVQAAQSQGKVELTPQDYVGE